MNDFKGMSINLPDMSGLNEIQRIKNENELKEHIFKHFDQFASDFENIYNIHDMRWAHTIVKNVHASDHSTVIINSNDNIVNSSLSSKEIESIDYILENFKKLEDIQYANHNEIKKILEEADQKKDSKILAKLSNYCWVSWVNALLILENIINNIPW